MVVPFFFRKTGKEPNGRVILRRQEGYFLLACLDRDDYKNLDPDGTSDTEGGAFYEIFNYEGGRLPWVITTSKDPNEAGNAYIEKHERQHWLNKSVFRDFDTLEARRQGTVPYSEKDGAPADVLIKDELLAYIRDGRNADSIEAHLFSETYKKVLSCSRNVKETEESIDGQTYEKNKDLVSSITSLLEVYDTCFAEPTARAELVYMLLNVSLEKMPKYISAIVRAERIKKDDSVFSPIRKTKRKK